MTFLRETIRNGAVGVGVSETLEGLSVLRQPGCAAALMRRQKGADYLTWLRDLDPSLLPSARVILRPNQVRKAAQQVFDIAGAPDCVEREALLEDAAVLAETFERIVPAPFLRLRFDVIETNACRRFHIDAVVARLICTYRGTGTQYGISVDGNEPSRVFTVPTGSPIILRGTLWPEEPKTGLLHRSPPIEGTGETRLLLVLDPVFDLEAEA